MKAMLIPIVVSLFCGILFIVNTTDVKPNDKRALIIGGFMLGLAVGGLIIGLLFEVNKDEETASVEPNINFNAARVGSAIGIAPLPSMYNEPTCIGVKPLSNTITNSNSESSGLEAHKRSKKVKSGSYPTIKWVGCFASKFNSSGNTWNPSNIKYSDVQCFGYYNLSKYKTSVRFHDTTEKFNNKRECKCNYKCKHKSYNIGIGESAGKNTKPAAIPFWYPVKTGYYKTDAIGVMSDSAIVSGSNQISIPIDVFKLKCIGKVPGIDTQFHSTGSFNTILSTDSSLIKNIKK